MLGIAIDAIVLIVLLKTMNDEEVGFGSAFLIALLTAIGTMVLAAVLASAMGIGGIVVAAIIASGLLGLAVSAMYGVEIKTSMIIAGVFMLVHIAVGIGVNLMFAT